MLPKPAFSPLATLLRNRKFGLVLIGALCLHVIFTLLNLQVWECPFFRLTGMPCPGCGLTRACLLLLQGNVHASLKFHAFAPIFLVLLFMMSVSTLLPLSVTEPFIRKAEILERQSGLTIIIMGGLILYWLARVLLFPSIFAQLIRG